MDDLTLLLTDHSLLAAQVTRLVGLVRLGRRSDALSIWHRESLGAAESLRQQLVEHFEFETGRLFPAMTKLEPSWAKQIDEFEAEHERILGVLDDFRAELLLSEPGQHPKNLLPSVLLVESRFLEHADLETKFFTHCGNAGFTFALAV